MWLNYQEPDVLSDKADSGLKQKLFKTLKSAAHKQTGLSIKDA